MSPPRDDDTMVKLPAWGRSRNRGVEGYGGGRKGVGQRARVWGSGLGVELRAGLRLGCGLGDKSRV